MRRLTGIYAKLRDRFVRIQGQITPDAVKWGYRLFLDREPESAAVVADKLQRLANTRHLRQEFLSSDEFKQKNPGACGALTLSGDEPPMLIEMDGNTDLEKLFSPIQDVWKDLGETEPYWSVLSAEQFKRASIQENRGNFYDSGRHNVGTLFRALERNDIDYTSFKTCLEYGCGLGRVTRWLAERFEEVFGYDISPSHLRLAKDYLTGLGVRNVSLRHISKLQDITNLPKVDVVYSILVLQHNPPPIISLIIQEIIKCLNSGGSVFFQVPTYRIDYKFSFQEYVNIESEKRGIEMHVLPQSEIFDIIRREGGRLIEILEDGLTGLRYGERSNTLLVQKI